MWEKMMCHMIIKSAENEIGRPAERMKIVRAFYLVREPGRFYVAVFIGMEVFRFLHMV